MNNNYDKLFNALISHLEENKLGWSNSIIVSTGIPFIKCLTSLLWHITCHHDNFVKREVSIFQSCFVNIRITMIIMLNINPNHNSCEKK